MQEELKQLSGIQTGGLVRTAYSYGKGGNENDKLSKMRLEHQKRMLQLQQEKEELALLKELHDLKKESSFLQLDVVTNGVAVTKLKQSVLHDFEIFVDLIRLLPRDQLDITNVHLMISVVERDSKRSIMSPTRKVSFRHVAGNDGSTLHYFELCELLRRVDNSQSCRMIIEVYCGTAIYGWTMMELFDLIGALRIGYWNVRLFDGPVSTDADISKIANDPEITSSSIYLRIFSIESHHEQTQFDIAKSGRQQFVPLYLTREFTGAPRVEPLSTRSRPSLIASKNISVFDSVKNLLRNAIQNNAAITSQKSLFKSQAIIQQEKNIRLVIENFSDMKSLCDRIKVRLVDDVSEKVLPDLKITMDPTSYQLKNTAILVLRGILPSLDTYVHLELCNGNETPVGWTRFYLFARPSESETRLDVNDGLKQLSLYKQTIASSNIALSEASIWVRASEINSTKKSSSVAVLEIPAHVFVSKKIDPDRSLLLEECTGFFLFIDSARYLPANIGFSRVQCCIFDSNFKPVDGCAKVATAFGLEMTCRMPNYDYFQGFSTSKMNAHSIIVFKLYGRDIFTGEVRYLGFTLWNVFNDMATDEQPNEHSYSTCYLNQGNFQLPIYTGRLKVHRDLNMETLRDYSRIPCASLLVRISASSETESPTPIYSQGLYDSSRCIPADKEVDIYSHLATIDPGLTYKDLLACENRELTSEQADEYLGNLFQTAATKQLPLDLSFICQYNPTLGFKISVDALQNISKKQLAVCIVSLSTPAILYGSGSTGTTPSASLYRHTTMLDFNSSITSPQFNDGYWTFRPELNDEEFLIIDVRTFNHGKQSQIENYAWTIFPIFAKEYVKHGLFQLPLFKGSPDTKLLDHIKSETVTKFLDSCLKNSSPVKYLLGESVFIRTCDARRDNELLFRRDIADTRYLPQEMLRSYQTARPANPIHEQAPKNISHSKLLQLMTSEIQAKFNLN